MSVAAIQAALNRIADEQVPNQFGPQRYALLFEPGIYGSHSRPLVFQVGYYTEVAGLGTRPGDTVINGVADVFNRCFGPPDPADGGGTGCVGTDNFWRSLYNVTLNPVTGPAPRFLPPVPDTHDYTSLNGAKRYNPACNAGREVWAASQAAPMRRVIVNGFLSLDDTCGDENYTSGGFIADSELLGGARNGSQQQFLVRNSTIDRKWTNGVWDQVFLGDNGDAVPAQSFGALSLENNGPEPYTTLPSTQVSVEEPYLIGGDGGYGVAVPPARHNTVGPSWSGPGVDGPVLPISRFFVADPQTKEGVINAALASGKDLIFTPGVYRIGSPVLVGRANTIVLGLGFATLVPTRGNTSMSVAPNRGVRISGLIFDAGPTASQALLRLGTAEPQQVASPGSPDVVQDTYFRVGGATPGSAVVSFVDDADGSIIDNVWAWRADHGTSDRSTGWTSSSGSTGLLVTGDDVSAYGLFVEHYEKSEVIWSGQGGTDVFFQNEMPYDPPSQAVWAQDTANDGYPAFLVTSNVRTFRGYGMASYCFFNAIDAPGNDAPPVQAARAFESPIWPGVHWKDLVTVSIDGTGVIRNIIDSSGGSSIVGTPSAPATIPVNLTSFP